MSKNRKRRQSSGKGPAQGGDSDNPFDRIKKTSTSASFSQKKARRSKFVNHNINDPLMSQPYHRKAERLQLYNLNEPISLTHKNEPIEDHYEDEVSDNSEDDFRYSGDVKDLPQALEEHRQRRAMERQMKEDQRELLSKLDSTFEKMDMAPFMRPKKGDMEYISQKATDTATSAPDKFEENLRHLLAAPLQSKHGGDLLKDLYAAKTIAEKCDIAKRFMNGNYVSEDAAEKCIVGIARALGQALESQPEYQDFCSHFETLTALVHYLCQRNNKGYKEYFSKFLGGIYVSFEQGVHLSTEAVLVLFILLKVLRTDSAMYSGAMVVLEMLMEECNATEENLPQLRLLVAASFSVILETGLYIPSFYKLCMRICSSKPHFKLEIIETILDMVVVSLKLLSSRGCHVHPICLHILSPNIASIEVSSQKLDKLNKLVQELLDVELKPGVLDIYLRPKVELHTPKYTTISAKEHDRDSTVKQEKELYKSMKREFLRTAVADAKRRSLDLQKRREKSKERYRQVVRDAMMEQEMLRKEFTKPT